MKVILKEYVYKHGVAGDVVTVADGFARNYLIPRGLAVKATPGAIRASQHLLENATARRAELRSAESQAAAAIDGVELVFGVKAGKNGKLYGSITTMDIARALQEKTGIDINRRRISERSLRELGNFVVPVRMGTDLSPTLKIAIIREEELADYLAGKDVSSLSEEPVAEEELESVEETGAEEAQADEEAGAVEESEAAE
jgi:large subunit ribosomal protein L9